MKDKWIEYVRSRIQRIMEGIMYMSMCKESDGPVTRSEFDKLMNFCEVLKLERKLYMEKTNMILDMFDLLLNYNPKAPEVVRNQYKENLYNKIKLVKETVIGLEK